MSNTKKLLVVAPQPFFQPRGTPFSVYYRTLITTQLGFNVDLLAYGEGQDVEMESLKVIRTPRFAFLGNVKIGPSALKLFLDIFIFIQMVWLLTTRKYHTVHAHEEAVFIAVLLKPIFRYKLIYDMHSSLPQQLENFEFSKAKWLILLFEKLERWALKRSDGIITICPDLKEYVNSVLGEVPHHFLIENSIFDPVKLRGESSSTDNNSDAGDYATVVKKAEQFNQEGPLAVYAGTLESYQGIEILIESMVTVCSADEQFRLIVLGGTDSQIAHFQEMVERFSLAKQVWLHKRVPQAIASEVLAKADVLVSPRSAGTNTPLKVYEQLSSGKPLVATNIYSHTQVLSEDVCFLSEPDAKSFGQALVIAFTDKNAIASRVDGARRLYAESYSKKAYVSKMELLFKAVEL